MIAGQDRMGTVSPNNSHSRCKNQVLWSELILGSFLCGTGEAMGRKLMRSRGRKCYPRVGAQLPFTLFPVHSLYSCKLPAAIAGLTLAALFLRKCCCSPFFIIVNR